MATDRRSSKLVQGTVDLLILNTLTRGVERVTSLPTLSRPGGEQRFVLALGMKRQHAALAGRVRPGATGSRDAAGELAEVFGLGRAFMPRRISA